MSGRTVWLLTLAVAAVGAALGQSSTSTSSPAGEQKPAVFAPGQDLVLVYRQDYEEVVAAKSFKVEMSFDCPLKIKSAHEGLLQVDMSIRRAVYKVKGDTHAGNVSIDTDQLAAAGDHTTTLLQAFTKCQFRAIVTPGGEVRKFESVGEPAAGLRADVVDGIRQMLELSTSCLPAKGAVEGDLYHVSRKCLAGQWFTGAPMQLLVQTNCKIEKLSPPGLLSAPKVILSGKARGKALGQDLILTLGGNVAGPAGGGSKLTTTQDLSGRNDKGQLRIRLVTELSGNQAEPDKAKTQP